MRVFGFVPLVVVPEDCLGMVSLFYCGESRAGKVPHLWLHG